MVQKSNEETVYERANEGSTKAAFAKNAVELKLIRLFFVNLNAGSPESRRI